MHTIDQNTEKMSPLYFHTHNTVKKYLDDKNINFNVNDSNNIELFTLEDYKLINDNLLTILKEVEQITIDNIEFLWSKNIILKLPNNEVFNIFCHLNCIDEIKNIIKNIINKVSK